MKFDQYLLGRSRDEHVQMFVVVCVNLHGLSSPGTAFRIYSWSWAAYKAYSPPPSPLWRESDMVGGWTYSLMSLNHGVVVMLYKVYIWCRWWCEFVHLYIVMTGENCHHPCISVYCYTLRLVHFCMYRHYVHVWVDYFSKVPVILYGDLQHRLHQLCRQLQITRDKMTSSSSHGSKSVSNDSCSDLW
jgi:hypothetical protein